MRDLDPCKIYTSLDVKNAGLDVNNMVGTRDSSRHNCYGMILEKLGNNKYRLYQELIPVFNRAFW